jgi:hypothetical protein
MIYSVSSKGHIALQLHSIKSAEHDCRYRLSIYTPYYIPTSHYHLLTPQQHPLTHIPQQGLKKNVVSGPRSRRTVCQTRQTSRKLKAFKPRPQPRPSYPGSPRS